MLSPKWVLRSDSPEYTLLVDEHALSFWPYFSGAFALLGFALVLIRTTWGKTETTHWARHAAIAMLGVLAMVNIVAALAAAPILSATTRLLYDPMWRAIEIIGGSSALVVIMVALAFKWRTRANSLACVAFALGAFATIPLQQFVTALHNLAILNLGFDGYADGEKPLVHVGRATSFSPIYYVSRYQVFGGNKGESASFTGTPWTPRETHVTPTQPGLANVDLEIDRPYVRYIEKFEIDVGEDRANAALPLAVGNAWAFALTNVHSSGNLWGHQATTNEVAGTADVNVTEEKWVGSLRTFSVSVTTSDSPKTFRVYGWNGETKILDGENAYESDPFFVVASEVQGERACFVAFFSDFECTCTPARDAFKIAAPLKCHRVNHNMVGGIVEGFAMLLTLGLSPITSQATNIELTAAHAN